jgi:hypothetical protein
MKSIIIISVIFVCQNFSISWNFFKKQDMVINNFFQHKNCSNNDIFLLKTSPQNFSQSIAYNNNMKGCLRFCTFTFWILSNLAKHTYEWLATSATS